MIKIHYTCKQETDWNAIVLGELVILVDAMGKPCACICRYFIEGHAKVIDMRKEEWSLMNHRTLIESSFTLGETVIEELPPSPLVTVILVSVESALFKTFT